MPSLRSKRDLILYECIQQTSSRLQEVQWPLDNRLEQKWCCHRTFTNLKRRLLFLINKYKVKGRKICVHHLLINVFTYYLFMKNKFRTICVYTGFYFYSVFNRLWIFLKMWNTRNWRYIILCWINWIQPIMDDIWLLQFFSSFFFSTKLKKLYIKLVIL